MITTYRVGGTKGEIRDADGMGLHCEPAGDVSLWLYVPAVCCTRFNPLFRPGASAARS